MTAIFAADHLADSDYLIDALERHKNELPFASEHLAIHHSCWQTLRHCQHKSDGAVDAWRVTLAHRWECEIAARRLYKQVFRQYLDHRGDANCLVGQSFASRHDNSAASPLELVADLRSLHADLGLGSGSMNIGRSEEIMAVCTALDEAIRETDISEAARRAAVLDRRVAQEAIRRARSSTQLALAAYPAAPPELVKLFV